MKDETYLEYRKRVWNDIPETRATAGQVVRVKAKFEDENDTIAKIKVYGLLVLIFGAGIFFAIASVLK